ncbi:replication initiation protein [Carnobacterium divergens]|uniref:replication initiation protein n=1 Tax=Carnobacterium divergens TaxID=2748 RepID=UPI003B974CFF
MSNIKVKYKNDLNLIPMRSFTSNEMDLFFAICARMEDKNLATIRFTFEDLKALSAYKPTANIRLVSDLKQTYHKMLQLQCGFEDDLNAEYFVLFTGFKIDSDNGYVDIRVNSDFEYVLNSLSKEFTKFELQEFTAIRSSYAKTMYRLLKQYKSTGFYKVRIEDFKRILDIPKSYAMSDIDKKVLKPIMNELSDLFKPLIIKKIKAKKGNKIALLEFTFKEKIFK